MSLRLMKNTSYVVVLRLITRYATGVKHVFDLLFTSLSYLSSLDAVY